MGNVLYCYSKVFKGLSFGHETLLWDLFTLEVWTCYELFTFKICGECNLKTIFYTKWFNEFIRVACGYFRTVVHFAIS